MKKTSCGYIKLEKGDKILFKPLNIKGEICLNYGTDIYVKWSDGSYSNKFSPIVNPETWIVISESKILKQYGIVKFLENRK